MTFHAPNVRTLIIFLAALLCVLWGSGVWFYESNQFKLHTEKAIDKINEYGIKRGKAMSADIRRSFNVMFGLPEVFSSMQEVVNALKSHQLSTGTEKQRLEKIKAESKLPNLMQVNRFLGLAAKKFSANVIWLLDVNGDCIAASNFDQENSFVANNFKERDYFSFAMSGQNSYQFAVGKVTHRPGLYFSAPVYLDKKVIGVVVVKVDVAHLAKNIDIANTFLADENGVVILSDDKNFIMKTLPNPVVATMSPERRQSIYKRDQFDTVRILSWPDKRYKRLFKLEDFSDAYVLNTTSINEGKLKIIVLSPATEVLLLEHEYLRLFFLVTLCGAAIVIISAGIVLYVHGNYVTRRLLKMQHDELNEAQHIAQMGSWSYDYATEKPHFSHGLFKNFLMLEDATAKPTLDLALVHVHPEDKERVKQTIKNALKSDTGYKIVYRLVRKNGEIRSILGKAVVEQDAKGKRIKITGTIRDITEEQRVLRALEDSENHLKKVMNSSLIGIIQGDNNFILYMNNAFITLTGYTQANLTDHKLTWQDIASSNYQKLDSENIFGQTNTPVPFEMELKCSDNKLLQVLIGMSKIEDSRSEWVCFVLDLTERNRMNRLKSEFISIVSHELRTPLTSIRGSLALLENGISGELEEKSMGLVKIAHRNSKRLIDIVNDILDMEKLAAGKMVFEMKSIEFVGLIKQAIESNEAFATHLSVKYVIHEFPESAYIWGDANRLIQVITNLLSNAAKFSPKGGEVELRLIEVNHQWRLEVRDYGSGIPEKFRNRIFGAFAQAENANTRQKGGTGLGLNITKIMVEKMDGMIGFDSEEGKGALFWVSFAVL